MKRLRYVVDSDVFIIAKNLYYRFDICPGFWESLIHHHNAGHIISIQKILEEIKNGNKDEDLVEWVSRDLPGTFLFPINCLKYLSNTRQ